MSGTIDSKKNRAIGVDDYVGTVGNEHHAIHQTHFSGADLSGLGGESIGEWIETAPGRWKRVKREKHENKNE